MAEIQSDLKVANEKCSNNLKLNYNQPAGTIFTNWESAGLYGVKHNTIISNYPLTSANNLKSFEIIHNNNNNVRNNFQNHSEKFLENFPLLNNLSLTDGAICDYKSANFQ